TNRVVTLCRQCKGFVEGHGFSRVVNAVNNTLTPISVIFPNGLRGRRSVACYRPDRSHKTHGFPRSGPTDLDGPAIPSYRKYPTRARCTAQIVHRPLQRIREKC